MLIDVPPPPLGSRLPILGSRLPIGSRIPILGSRLPILRERVCSSRVDVAWSIPENVASRLMGAED